MATLGRMTDRIKKRPPILVRRRAKKEAARAQEARRVALGQQKEATRRARGHVPVNPLNLGRNVSYGIPDFVTRGYYVDRPFNCKECGTSQIWTENQQKWWYEAAKGDLWAVAVLCRPCRRREQARKAAARKIHLDGLAKKRATAA
jgi:hypothetical protein